MSKHFVVVVVVVKLGCKMSWLLLLLVTALF